MCTFQQGFIFGTIMNSIVIFIMVLAILQIRYKWINTIINWFSTDLKKPTVKLGKLPKKVGLKTLCFEKYLLSKIKIPVTCGRLNIIQDWLMLANDTLGDCTIAAIYHLEMLWKKMTNKIFNPTNQEAITTYSEITGYNPSNPNSDQGAIISDVLSYWKIKGIFNEVQDGQDKINAYVEIKNVLSTTNIKIGTYLFNGVDIGFEVPQYILDSGSKIWDIQKKGNHSIAGGHSVTIIDYDSKYFYVVSWGQIYKMTFDFYQKYCDEAWVAISNDYFNGTKSVEGYDLQTLLQDMSAIG